MNKVQCSASWSKSRSEEVMLHIDVQPAAATSVETNSEAAGQSNPIPNNKGINILRIYFRFMYWIGISTFGEEGELARKILIKILHWMIFVIFCILSLLRSAEQIKDNTIGNLEPGEIFNHVFLGFAVLTGVVRLMFFYVVVFKHGEVIDLLNLFAMTEMRNCSRIIIGMAKLLPYILSFCTIVYGVCKSVFITVELSKFSPTALVLERAWEVSYTISFWSSEALNNDTIREEHTNKFANATVPNVLLGIFGICTDLMNGIHQYACLSVLLIIVISMYIATFNLGVPFTDEGVIDSLGKTAKVKAKGKDARKREKLAKKKKKQEEKARAQKFWKEYIHLRHLSKLLERTIGTLLRWTHCYYLLIWGHFLLTNLDGKINDLEYVINFARLLSVVLTYYFAIKSSQKNKAFREWVLRYYKNQNTIVIDGERVDRSIVLEDMANHPIGIGNDIFYIDDIFVFKMKIFYLVPLFVFLISLIITEMEPGLAQAEATPTQKSKSKHKDG